MMHKPFSQNAGKWHSESTKFQIFFGGMPLNPPSLVDANHSCKIQDPPLEEIVQIHEKPQR